eukprot:COSAG06_NODE_916_length_11564_cov_7.148190_4_plen_54_part_00
MDTVEVGHGGKMSSESAAAAASGLRVKEGRPNGIGDGDGKRGGRVRMQSMQLS